MSEPAGRASRQAPSRAAFGRGLVAVLAVFIALAGVIHLANHGHHRPEGDAESWLSAVSDTTRKGVHDVSLRRAEKLSVMPLDIARPLLSRAGDTDGHRAFTDLEVGKAHTSPQGVRVPFRVHLYVRSGTSPELAGALLLGRPETGGGWVVFGLTPRMAGEKVPSEGGPPPSRAPLGLWVGALAVGLVIAALASLAVRLAGRGPDRFRPPPPRLTPMSGPGATRLERIEGRVRNAKWKHEPFKIDMSICINCDTCLRHCPPQFGAIFNHGMDVVILPELCSGCGKCLPPVCPVDCIVPDPDWAPAPDDWWEEPLTANDPYK